MLFLQTLARANAGSVELFLDGESGTWRLFLDVPDNERGQCIDFTLDNLRTFRDELSNVLNDIDRDPDSFNAEVRRTWEQ